MIKWDNWWNIQCGGCNTSRQLAGLSQLFRKQCLMLMSLNLVLLMLYGYRVSDKCHRCTSLVSFDVYSDH